MPSTGQSGDFYLYTKGQRDLERGKTSKVICLVLCLGLAACNKESESTHVQPENKSETHVTSSHYRDGTNRGKTYTDRGSYKVDASHTSTGFSEKINFLILHYTSENASESLRLLTKSGKVGSHYLILEKPEIQEGKPVVLQLVPEAKSAWHAGVGYWRGQDRFNDQSIGVEIVNPGYTEDDQKRKTWYAYPQTQTRAVIALAKDVIERYGIKPEHVIGHSDLAPLRKFDPGPKFPWKQLAQEGIGAWPDDEDVRSFLAGRRPYASVNVRSIQNILRRYGYTIPQTGRLDKNTQRVISAFQAHFRPENIEGKPDAQTEAIARALVKKYGHDPSIRSSKKR